MSSDLVWYRARLLPAAQNIFTKSFYPEPAKRTGNQYVWVTQLNSTPTNPKVLVASKPSEAGLRVLTLPLALSCLEPKEKATKTQMAELNLLVSKLRDKLE